MHPSQHRLSRTILSTLAFIAITTGSAKADIVQCTDATGGLVFTDAPCRSDKIVGRAPGLVREAAGKTMASKQAKRFVAAEQARVAAMAGKPVGGRKLALDHATSEAARITMLSNDEAWAVQREQALAGQRVPPEFWQFWRS